MNRTRPKNKTKKDTPNNDKPLRLNCRTTYTQEQLDGMSLKEVEELLTIQQVEFCKHYVTHRHMTKAYMYAYNIEKTERNEKSAAAAGSRLLHNVKIKRFLALIKEEHEYVTGITKNWVLEEHSKIARASIAEIHNNWITREEWNKIKKNNPDVLDAIQSIDTKIEKKLNFKKDLVEIHYVKIQLYSKQTSLKEISTLMGYNKAEKVEIEHTHKEIDWSKYTEEEIAVLMKMARLNNGKA